MKLFPIFSDIFYLTAPFSFSRYLLHNFFGNLWVDIELGYVYLQEFLRGISECCASGFICVSKIPLYVGKHKAVKGAGDSIGKYLNFLLRLLALADVSKNT